MTKNRISEEIFVANLKCSGCAATIQKELLKLDGVDSVNVDLENSQIKIESSNTDRKIITKRLHELGYPEATEENGLLLQLKSMGSCLIGRINNK